MSNKQRLNQANETFENTLLEMINNLEEEKIRSISLNGVEQPIVNRNVDIKAAPAYTYGTTDIGAGVPMEGEEGSLYFVIE